MTLRRVKAGRLNTVRNSRSVNRCWISISSTAASARFGLIDWRHLSKNSANAAVKVLVAFPLLLDQLGQALPDVRDPVLELGDGLLPRRILLRPVAEEHLQRLDQLPRVRQIRVQRQPPVLPQHRPPRRLKQDIVARVARRKLALHLRRQIIVDVLRLPAPVRQPEVVHQRPVHHNPPAPPRTHSKLRHQRPPTLPRAMPQQPLKRRPHRRLMRDVEPCKLVKRGVIVSDRFVRGFERQGGHSVRSSGTLS